MKKIFAAALVLALGSNANAGLIAIGLSEDGGAQTVVASNPSAMDTVSFTGNFGDFSLILSFGTSNVPGTAASGLVSQATLQVTNNSGTAHTLGLNVSSQDFTQPQGTNLMVTDTVSGSVTKGRLNGVNFQGFADNSNALFGTGFASQDLTNAAVGGGLSFHDNGMMSGYTPSALFSMTAKAAYTLNGGTSITLVGGNVETVGPQASVPEPASLTLFGLGLVGLGGIVWRRRKSVA